VAYACVDIGSNTTRLLVAEADDGRLRELMTQRVYNRLGEGLSRGNGIAPDKADEVARVVATQVRQARELGVEEVSVVATAAIREAADRDQLTATVASEAGFPVIVLDDTEEARLAFLGATKTLGTHVEGPVAVIDVGGGSTEIAVGTVDGGMSWSESFRIGSGFLTDSYVSSDPPAVGELHAVREQVLGRFEGLEVPPVERAVAVGGSATSLRRLVGAELAHDTLERAIQILCTTEISEIATRFELDARRVRLLPAGMLILESISDALGMPLTIGNGGLREGVIIDMLAVRRASEAD
jgi:exopolyphosphatase/guanosine-5'-triphosphate,3'-diphosphate pyrophosphatase